MDATSLARDVECTGEMQVTPDFLLTARADRLDALTSGGLAIIDYKTGTPPRRRKSRSLSPQLPLEGLIARQRRLRRRRRRPSRSASSTTA